MVDLDPAHRRATFHRVVLLRLVGDDDDLLRALGVELRDDLRHGERAVDRLAARHRHRVVVENLVGDVDAGGDRGADRQDSGVEVSAVAEVGEDVLLVGERGLPDPRRTLAAHLRERAGTALGHPVRHVVATDAGQRARALGNVGRRVVRAARAEGRHALDDRVRRSQRTLLRVDDRQPRLDLRAQVARQLELRAELAGIEQARGDGLGDQCRRQLGVSRKQPASARHRPLAAAIVLLVELAVDARAHVVAPVVELFLQRVFDDLALLFDDQDLVQAGGELAHGLRLERPDHAALEQPHADASAGRLVEPEIEQRLARVEIRLATGDDAEPRARRVDHRVVQPVGTHIGERRIPLVVEQPRLLRERRVGPADVQPVGRQLEVGRNHDVHAIGVDVHRSGRLDHLGHRLHRDPQARPARHRPAVQAEVEVLLYRRRIEHRQPAGLEDVVGLVRQRRGLRAVVVAGQHQHAAVAARAGRIGVLEDVAAAVHARTLAVPHREDAVDARLRRQVHLLRAPDAGGGDVLVQPRLEDHLVRREVLARLPQRLVQAAERRAAIARDEACAVQPGAAVALALQHRQAHQRLRARHERAPAFERVLVVERHLRERALESLRNRTRNRCVHRDGPPDGVDVLVNGPLARGGARAEASGALVARPRRLSVRSRAAPGSPRGRQCRPAAQPLRLRACTSRITSANSSTSSKLRYTDAKRT